MYYKNIYKNYTQISLINRLRKKCDQLIKTKNCQLTRN